MSYLLVLLFAVLSGVLGSNTIMPQGELHSAVEQSAHSSARELLVERLPELPGSLASLPTVSPDMRGYWYKIQLPGGVATSGQAWFLQVDFPNIDCVDFYLPVKDGWQHYEVGDEIRFSRWPVKYHIPSIPLAGIVSDTLYAKVSIDSFLVFPLVLVDRSELQTQVDFSNRYYSALYASILVLLVYNFFLYLFLRDPSCILYVFYVASFALVQLSVSGIGQQFLWPQWDGVTTRIALLAIAITNGFLPYFVIHFLSLATAQQTLCRMLKVGAWLPLALVPFVFVNNYAFAQYGLQFISVVNMLVIFAATLIMVQQKSRSAVYLLVSYLVLFLAIFLALFQQNGWIETGFWVKHLMEIAILFEALLLSIGLTDRINKLRIENLRIANEKRRDQERFYAELVEVRDKEKYELGKTLHDSVSHDLLVIKNRLNNDLDLTSLLDQVMAKVRNISHMMHPYHIEQLGFELAAEELVERSFKGTKTRCFGAVHCGDIPKRQAALLYSLLQECLNNIVKHARASECVLQISKIEEIDDSRVILSIKDDGVGFDVSAEHQGLGLRMAKHSIEASGGSMTVYSQPGKGAHIVFELPLSAC